MISKLKKYKIKYLLNGSKVMVESGGKLEIESNVKIEKSTIYVESGGYLKISSNTIIVDSNLYLQGSGCTMKIGSNCFINGIDLGLKHGKFIFGEYSLLENVGIGRKLLFSVDGRCEIGKYNRIRSAVWVRFGGELLIGDRNVINEYSEIRCDEKVCIGDYNQVSYNCTIWDTNTHCIYAPEKRRELTDKQYPGFGEEIEKPLTNPICIGNDCWLGKNCSILKGTTIEDKSIVGFGTLISGKQIPSGSKVISKSTLDISPFENWANQ